MQRRASPLAAGPRLPSGCQGVEMLVSAEHAITLFDAILPSVAAEGASAPASVAAASDRPDTVLALSSLYDQIFTRLDVLRPKLRDLE